MSDSTLHHAYADLLTSFSWDFFVTQTFKAERRDPIYTAKAFYQVLEDHFGASRAFVAVEPHRTGSLHIHALTRHLFRPEVDPSWIWKYCFKAFGRNRVETAKDDLAVNRYCAKYVTKAGFHYEFFGCPDAWKQDSIMDY